MWPDISMGFEMFDGAFVWLTTISLYSAQRQQNGDPVVKSYAELGVITVAALRVAEQ